MFYSGAIVEYLIEKYGRGRFSPDSATSKLDNTFFMHYAEGSFMPPLVLKMVFSTIQEKSPFFVRPFTSIVANQICSSFIDPANQTNFRLVDWYLRKDGGRAFLAGGNDPTGGDFMVSEGNIRFPQLSLRTRRHILKLWLCDLPYKHRCLFQSKAQSPVEPSSPKKSHRQCMIISLDSRHVQLMPKLKIS